MADWNPEIYARFRDLRQRPALDLLARVPDLPPGPAIDLGCGDGVMGPALRERFPALRIEGVDRSPAMLGQARTSGAYDALAETDIAAWQPAGAAPALIFSNAALQWLPDHGTLFPRLAGLITPGGVLAVQMPRQYGAPSHRFLRDFAADMFPDRFDMSGWHPPVALPSDYVRMLSPLGRVDAWETDYIQRLMPGEGGHPVRAFTEATAMRPIVEKLDPDEHRAFTERYEAALSAAYPAEADGSVLFPFRRLFIVLVR